MTDGKGRTVDFKNTILIMTSNLGSDLIMKMTEERGRGNNQSADRRNPDASL
jgi:ATP-dependent Clp protease ATP-binding subunit ClpA